MKGDADVAERDRFAVGQRLDADVRPEPAFEQTPGRLGAQIRLTAGPGVVAVDVRDERAVRRAPGIDVEAAGRAEEAGWAFDQQAHGSWLKTAGQRLRQALDRVAAASRGYAAYARRALMNSQATGRTEMKMMMIATAEKFSFTIGTLPKM